MLALWWIGRPLEDYLGPVRYLLLYLVSGLAGSAGALIVNPTVPTVGASGAVYGILGAAIVLERQGTYVLGGRALTLLHRQPRLQLRRARHLDRRPPGRRRRWSTCILVLTQLGKRSAAYSRIDLLSIVSLVAIGFLSVAVAYWKVRGYA